MAHIPTVQIKTPGGYAVINALDFDNEKMTIFVEGVGTGETKPPAVAKEISLLTPPVASKRKGGRPRKVTPPES